jgi:hypothetical protein
MGNLIPSNNNDDNLDFNPTKLPGCKVWLDASDESTLFTTDYQGSVTVPDNFVPTSVGGCSTWYDSSDASTLYNTSAGPVTAVSSPTEVSGCALWLDASDSSTLYKTDAAAAIPVASPLDIGGCVAWWDGSDISTFFQNNDGTSPVTASGQLVGSWVDKANSRIASAPGTNNKPMYQTSVVNGKSSLLFDGWNDYFSVLNMPSQTNETVFIVTRANFQESKTHVLIGDQSPTGYGITLYTSAAVNYIRGSYGGYTPGFTGFIYNMPGNSNIDPVLICARRNSSGASLREAGTDIQSSTTQFALAYRYIGADPGTGSVGMAGNNVLNGHICEIIIYSSDLSSSDRAKVESYLATKWGIQRTFDLAAAGSGVGSWKDKSGNVRDFTSATSKPTITASAIGGKSALSFDGVDDRLANSSTISSGNAGLSVFVVVRGTFPGNSTFLFTHKSAEGGLDSNDLSIGWSAEQGSAWLFGTLRSRSKSIRSGVAYTSDKRFDSIDVSGVGIASVVSSFAATSSTNSSFWQGAAAQSSLGTSDGVSLAGMTIGFRNGITPDLFYVGQIAEIIAFNTALSTTDRARIEKYLSNKWGIQNIHSPVTSGGPIGYWGDKSGNNKHATQEIGSYRPSYTGTINSLPAITFDGTDDHFLLGDLSSTFPNFGEVFIVFEPIGPSNLTYQLYQTSVNYPIYRYAGDYSWFAAFTGSRSSGGSYGIPNTGVHLTSMRANSSSMWVRFDGNQLYSQNGLGFNGGNSHAIGWAGHGSPGVGGPVMSGKIVEVITYNTDIGAENRAKVEQYLAKKWGINSNLHDRSNDPGEKIGYWKSKTSPVLGLTQHNITKRPSVSFLNNKKAVSFDDINGQYLVGYILGSDMIPGGECSFFWVANITTTAVAGNHIVFRYGNYSGYTLISKFDNKIEYGGTNGISLTTPPQTKNAPIIESVIKGNGNIFNATNAYRNGFLLNKSNFGINGNFVASGGLMPLLINSYNADIFFSGAGAMTIGEFIGYNRGVSDQERKLVEKYLNDKWNINALTTSISKPTDISGCSLWLDANDPKTLFTDTAASTNISADGQTIAYWADKVAGQDVIQATVAARPTYRTNMQNGRPMIYFDGGDDLLSQINRPYVAPCTLFVVCRIDSHSGDISGIMTHGDSTGGLNGPGFCYIGSTAAGACLVFLDGVGAGTAATSNTSSSMLGLPRVITGVYNQSNTSNSLIYANGNLEENFTGTGVALSATANRVQIGARTGGGQPVRRMIGYVAECIRYDRVLTDTERASVENYLSEKWGIGSYSSPNSIGSSIVRHKIKVSNKDAQNWIDRVFANGGSVSEKTADAVDKFCRDIESAGLRKKFYRLNLFCGNDLQACLTPLYLGPDSNRFYGFRTENNTGFFQNNYDEKNGLIAGPGSSTGGNGIYLLTGVSLSDMGLSDTGHMAFYQTQFNLDTNPYIAGNRPIIGAGDTLITLQGSNSVLSYYGGFNSIESAYFGGLYILTRNSSSDMKSYEAGVLRGSQTGSITIPEQTSTIGIFTSTNGSVASGSNYYFGYVKGYSVGQSMTQQEVSQYNTIMENFQTSLGRGLPTRSSAQFSSVSNEETKSWIDAVYANGGTVSSATALAVDNFCNSMDAAGLRNKFYRINLFCGGNLASCLVPLYRGPSRLGIRYGNARDINVLNTAGSNDFDYSESDGLLGNTQDISGNGFISRRYLRTGLITGSVTELNNNLHTAVYSKVLTSGGYAMGAYDGANTGFSLQIGIGGYNVGAFANSLLNFTNTSTPTLYPSNKGLYIGNYSNNLLTAYEGRANMLGQRDLTSTYALIPTTVSDMGIFGEYRHNNGIALFNYLDRLQGYSIGTSLSSSDVESYYDIIQTFQTALSRANTDPVLGSQFDAITNLDTRDWLTRVYKNGGTVSISTATAVQNFCNSIDSAGLRSRFYRLNLFCGDNLEACTVPLYRGDSRTGAQRGFLYDIGNNIITSDYNESGILSGIKGNGSNKYLATGLGTDFTDNSSLSFGAFITSPTETAFSTYLGVSQNTNADNTLLYYRDGFTRGLDGTTFYPSTPTNSILTGHHIYSRTASNSYFHGWNGTSGATSNSASSARGRDGFIIHASNNNGTMANYGNGRISMYHIGLGLTTQQVSAFNSAVEAFNAEMGRSRPSSQFTSVTNEDAKIWIDNVYSNGGTVSSTTASAVNTLCNSINSNNLRSKFYRMNLFCGNNLNAAMVPLYRGPDRTFIYGNPVSDTNNNFIETDYSASGLRGNGANAYLNTGVPSNFKNDRHLSVYATSYGTNIYRRLIGAKESDNSSMLVITQDIPNNIVYGLAALGTAGLNTGVSTAVNNPGTPGNLYTMSITGTSSLTASFYKDTTLRQPTTQPSAPTSTQPFYVFNENIGGSPSSGTDATLGMYSIGEGLSSSEISLFQPIIETFQTALSRGRPSSDPAFAAVTNAEAKLWIDNVYANGGTVSQSTANAVNTFCNSIESAGIRNRFYRLNLFAGNNLNAALVPLYRGQSSSGLQVGGSTDTNINFISDNYSESSGLNTTSGGGQYLNTNLSPDNMVLTDVQAMHLAFSHGPTTSGDVDPRPIGTASATDRFQMILTIRSSVPGVMTTWLGRTNSVISSNLATGSQTSASWVTARTSATSLSIYKNGVIDTILETSVTGILSHSNVFYVGLSNNNGATIGNSVALAHRHYSIGASMTASQISSYESALTVFRAAIGRVS